MPPADSQSETTRIASVGLTAVLLVSVIAGGIAFGATAWVPEDAEAAAQQESSSLRVVHASPDALPVDVAVDGVTVFENVSFGNATDYLSVDPGNHTVTVSTARGDEVLFEETVTLDAGANYTVAASGEAFGPTALQPVVLPENASPSEDEAALRLVHLSPDAPSVDVNVRGADGALFDNLTFGNSSGYVALPPGNYTLEVMPSTATGSEDVVATFNVTLENGTAYTAAAIGYLDPESAVANTSLELLTIEDTTVADQARNGTATPTGTEAGTTTPTGATPTGTSTPTGTEGTGG